jgi:hypothetical protein
MIQTVNLNNAPNQSQTVPLSVDGGSLTLILTLHYNEIADYWTMTIQDANGNLLVDSVPLVTGNWPACNILKQWAFLQIGSAYVLNQSGYSIPNYPDNTGLGTQFLLVWGDTPSYAGDA